MSETLILFQVGEKRVEVALVASKITAITFLPEDDGSTRLSICHEGSPVELELCLPAEHVQSVKKGLYEIITGRKVGDMFALGENGTFRLAFVE